MAESQKEKIMRNLGVSESEAEEILAADKAIDRGEKLFELSDEQKAVVKKMTATGERKKKAPTAYSFEKKPRKENPTKGAIIAELAEFLAENSQNACENVQILNKERQISFVIGENTYELTLVQKRAPKK